jgi:hypothetical protein
MDEVERAIQKFPGGAGSSLVSKLDALMDIEQLRDRRVVVFLLGVLVDEREPVEARVRVLKRLRDESLTAGLREPAAGTILRLVHAGCPPLLCIHAAQALAEFVDIEGVVAGLAALALNTDLPLDLRYSAFTSLERAGPTSDCVLLLRKLFTDDVLGASARSLLSAWHIDQLE